MNIGRFTNKYELNINFILIEWGSIMKNVIIGQSGGPTAVINSSLAGVLETAIKRGADNVYGMRYGVKGVLEGQIFDLKKEIGTSLGIELLKRTPACYLGSCRYKLPDFNVDETPYKIIFQQLNKLEIGYFIYIGGNDSMDTIAKLSAYAEKINSEIRFMGVPKTIDNDLEETDHTPGYGSAAKYIAVTAKELVRDSTVYGTKSVTVVEIMGRNAGWLAAASSLAKSDDCEGVDMIYLPEFTFDEADFLERVEKLQKVKPSLVIAVSEGIKIADGRYVCELLNEQMTSDVFGHKYLAGTANYLSNKLRSELGSKARYIELSTLQRCASHITSRTDITEAYQVGGAALKAAFEGESGKVAVLKRISNDPYQCKTSISDVSKIANLEKKVPLNWYDESLKQPTLDFTAYAKPLIQAELLPYYIDGTPRHICLPEIL